MDQLADLGLRPEDQPAPASARVKARQPAQVETRAFGQRRKPVHRAIGNRRLRAPTEENAKRADGKQHLRELEETRANPCWRELRSSDLGRNRHKAPTETRVLGQGRKKAQPASAEPAHPCADGNRRLRAPVKDHTTPCSWKPASSDKGERRHTSAGGTSRPGQEGKPARPRWRRPGPSGAGGNQRNRAIGNPRLRTKAEESTSRWRKPTPSGKGGNRRKTCGRTSAPSGAERNPRNRAGENSGLRIWEGTGASRKRKPAPSGKGGRKRTVLRNLVHVRNLNGAFGHRDGIGQPAAWKIRTFGNWTEASHPAVGNTGLRTRVENCASGKRIVLCRSDVRALPLPSPPK
jgi:hypothetical protein